MEKHNRDLDTYSISKKIHEDAKTKEELLCPECNNQLIVQRSEDWTKLYAVYCKQCGFGLKVSYSMKKGNKDTVD